MVKAVITHGQIRALEPLPADWHEGQPLRIDRVDERTLQLSPSTAILLFSTSYVQAVILRMSNN